MSQKNDTPLLLLSLLITAGILGGGYWWFTRQSGGNLGNLLPAAQNSPNPLGKLPPPPPTGEITAFAPPATVPAGTVVRINGSTSMVQINQALKAGFAEKFPGTQVITDAKGTEVGIAELTAGTVDVAAISRPLTPQETGQGLAAIPVAQDAIAIVVGVDNPFRRGLTRQQVAEIFQGQIDNWSAVGGIPRTIRVLNRPPFSGTHEAFQKLVLNGGNFGSTPNIEQLPRDATTPLLQALGTDGISYATYTQVADQQTARTVPIDGFTPESPQYPFQRTLYYAYRNPPNPAARDFLGYTTSSAGTRAIAGAVK
jgi:phosphate transport system substrate-binding protein